MKKSILLFFILVGASSLFAQQKGKVMTIDLKVIDGKGFTGTIDFVYGFNDCFGDAQMLYTYKNIKITKFFYNNKAYSASDLGITSFDEYLLSPDITVNVMRPLDYFKSGEPRYGGTAGGMQSSVKGDIQLKGVLEQQLAGCLGQTHKLGKAEKAKVDNYNLSLPLESGLDIRHLYLDKSKSKAYLNFSTTLVDLIKCADDPVACEEKKENVEMFKKELVKTGGFYRLQFAIKPNYATYLDVSIIAFLSDKKNEIEINEIKMYFSDILDGHFLDKVSNKLVDIVNIEDFNKNLSDFEEKMFIEVKADDWLFTGAYKKLEYIKLKENVFRSKYQLGTIPYDYICYYDKIYYRHINKNTHPTPTKPQNQETKPTEKKKSYWD